MGNSPEERLDITKLETGTSQARQKNVDVKEEDELVDQIRRVGGLNHAIVVEAKDGSATEEKIDDFTKSIINNLEANYDIRTPSGAESTRLAESSQVIAIRDLPNMFKGDRVRGRVISFQVIVRA